MLYLFKNKNYLIMFYKMAILNSKLSYSLLLKLLSNISKFYIIITPTISINYYIIYLILDSGNSITNLKDIKHLIIYNYAYNKIIYKIFRLYLSNYCNLNTNYIFIDYTLYNIQNIKIYNYLKSSKYLSIFNINKKLKYILYNFLHDLKKQYFWIYHKNITILSFLNNYIINYSNNIILLEYEQIQKKSIPILTELSTNKHKTSNYIYILVNLINNLSNNSQYLISNIITSIQINLKNIKQKYNILFLSNENIINHTYYNNFINYFTFVNLIQ